METPPMDAASNPATGKVYYVSGKGSDRNDGTTPQTAFRNIQTAANLTNPGDTVYVMNGTYTKADPNSDLVNISRSGTPDAWITYKAFPGHTPKLKSKNWSAIGIQASYIVVDGFLMEGNNKNITLETAIAEQNNINNPLTSGNGIGVVRSDDGANPHHVIIRNNTVYNFGGGGIYTYGADYVTIENNIVHNNALYSPYANSGISLYQSWDFDDNMGYKMIVRGNVSYNNQNLIPFFASAPEEKDRTITDGNGIIIDDSLNTQNGSTAGVYGGRTLVENNLVYNNGGRGIHVFESEHVDIVNNTTYRNSRHPKILEGEITVLDSEGITNDVRVLNNIIYAKTGRPANTVSQKSINVLYDYNLVFNNSQFAGALLNNIFGKDPQFEDPAAGNFSLRSTSPAIDRGTRELAPASDLSGTSRPQGNGVDIGALEEHAILPDVLKDLSSNGTRNSWSDLGEEAIASGSSATWRRGDRVVDRMPFGDDEMSLAAISNPDIMSANLDSL
jgi:parallel beta-helix repeat protein